MWTNVLKQDEGAWSRPRTPTRPNLKPASEPPEARFGSPRAETTRRDQPIHPLGGWASGTWASKQVSLHTLDERRGAIRGVTPPNSPWLVDNKEVTCPLNEYSRASRASQPHWSRCSACLLQALLLGPPSATTTRAGLRKGLNTGLRKSPVIGRPSPTSPTIGSRRSPTTGSRPRPSRHSRLPHR